MKSKGAKKLMATVLGIGFTGIALMVSCTKTNQTLDVKTADLPAVVTNPADLLCAKTDNAPTIDGIVDAVWDNATQLNTTTQVPDPGNGLFNGYVGTQYPVSLKSMYDGTYIYFLAQYADNDKSVQVSPWYFNPTTKRWAQEPSAKTFDSNGILTRDGWGEDKLAFLWNIDNSTSKFSAQTCYASCHTFTPYLDPTSTPSTIVMKPNASGNHYTNGANEKIDMWWLKIGRDPINGQFSDEYQDWAGGPSITNLVGGSGNGRHQDDQVVTGSSTTYPYGPVYSSNVGGTSNNSQTFTLTVMGKTLTTTAPKYLIPGKTDYYYILQTDIDAGVAKQIKGLDTLGVLTLSDGTKIDPNVGTDYQRVGDPVYGGVGPKIIPSYISMPLTKGRADISCMVNYTGSGWVIEWKRLLKTTDVLKQDIDFSSLQDQPFGVAIFNKSNYQHGIKPNLTLKFQK